MNKTNIIILLLIFYWKQCIASDLDIIAYSESRLIKPGINQYNTRLIVDKRQLQRIYHISTITSDKDSSVLNQFTAPLRMKQQTIISSDNNQWIYFPILDKSIKVSKNESLAGGTFSYGDIFNHSITKYYKIINQQINKEDNTIVFHMKSTSKESLYEEVIYTIDLITHFPISKKFITKEGVELKQLYYSDHDSYGSPMKWTFNSLTDPQSITILLIDNYKKERTLMICHSR